VAAGQEPAERSDERQRLLRVLAAATFVVFLPSVHGGADHPGALRGLRDFRRDGWTDRPAYLIPNGLATLAYGILADRLGLRRVMFASLVAFAVLTALTATARSVEAIAAWRVLTGLGASGVVPLALVLVGGLFPYEKRGRPLGWLFGAMAGEWPSARPSARCWNL